jgi:Ras GTPase-activating-like protein IQGAP2/3
MTILTPFPLSPPHQAEANPKVQQQIKEHVPVLQEFVLSVLHQLKDSIDEVPFGIRWLCKATRSLVMEKFPSAEVEAINSFIGGFFFLRYINPIIATPHGKEGGPRERT